MRYTGRDSLGLFTLRTDKILDEPVWAHSHRAFAFAFAMICIDVCRNLPSLSMNSTTEGNGSEMALQMQKQTKTVGVNEPYQLIKICQSEHLNLQA